MNSAQLKALSESILKDFQNIIYDLSSMSGYVYDKKTVERRERFYGGGIETLINNRLKQFQDAYTRRLNFLCKRALKEMAAPIRVNEELSTKLKFWSVIYKSKSIDIIKKKYQEAISQNNRDFIYFVENVLVDQKTDESHKKQIRNFTESKRKHRVKKETRAEIDELNKLYGFYIQSLEFTRSSGLNLTKIEKLFSSLNKNFRQPLKELLASAN